MTSAKLDGDPVLVEPVSTSHRWLADERLDAVAEEQPLLVDVEQFPCDESLLAGPTGDEDWSGPLARNECIELPLHIFKLPVDLSVTAEVLDERHEPSALLFEAESADLDAVSSV
jgi:hypothetical protein